MKLSIGTRLYFGFGMVLAFVVGACVLGVVVSSGVRKATVQMTESDLSALNAAQASKAVVYQAEARVASFMTKPSAAGRDEILKTIESLRGSLQTLGGVVRSETQKQTVINATEQLGLYERAVGELAKAAEQRGFNEELGVQGKLRAAVHAVETEAKARKQNELTILLLMCRRHEKDYFLRRDEKYVTQVGERVKEFSAKMEQLGLEEDVKKKMNALLADYKSGVDAVLAADKAVTQAEKSSREIASQLQQQVASIASETDQAVAAAKQRVSDLLGAQTNAMTLMLVIASVSGVLVAYLVTRSVVKPLRSVVHRMDMIANGDGDLTQTVDESRNDELGELARAFNHFVAKIAGVLRRVAQATDDVATGSSRIAAASTQFSAGIDEQSKQVNQIVAAVSELSASVGEVSQQAESVSGSAQQSGLLAGQGDEAVKKTISDIDGIRQSVQSVADIVTDLGRRGEEIGQIVSVINDIAEQTNLLALNAAIEAARAGEHGRGFAVVADEVRKLADRTTKATEEIGRSISLIRDQTTKAVGGIENGVKTVAAGTERARAAGGNMKSIVQNASQTAELVARIAAASREQGTATEQIGRSTESVSRVVQENAKGATESATAAEELSKKSAHLRELVSSFKLG
jgi:methyl-accepting chemotaxis protein